MHPIINEFISTSEPLRDILEKHHSKDNELELVFVEITKSFLFDIAQENEYLIKIDKAISNGHPDQNVFLLFIVACVMSPVLAKHIEKTNSLLVIADACPQKGLELAVSAFLLQAKARVKNREGNSIESEHLMREAAHLLPKDHPRYRYILANYASTLASQGKLKDLSDDEMLQFKSFQESTLAFIYLEAIIANNILTGNYSAGLGFINDFKNFFQGDRTYRIQSFIDSLRIISGDMNESNYQNEAVKIVVQIFNALSQGNIIEAIQHYKLFIGKISSIDLIPLLTDYIQLNIELGLGNTVTAKKILAEKEIQGNKHYLDYFFLMRIYLIEKDFASANSCLNNLIELVDRYDAMSRIQFELQFAKELKASDLFMILKNWRSIKQNKETINLPYKPIKSKLLGIDQLIGKSIEIHLVKDLIKKFAPLKEIVLITGETGTGKELVAKALHEEGANKNEPFLAINCGSLTDSLLESELFGFEAGSFTGAIKQKSGIFEAAGKGTVFLDEFGEISPKLQASLLRVLELKEIRRIGSTKTKKIECRIIIATNIDIKKAVATKTFREDLYFRLNRFEVVLPPLRERISDLTLLIEYFLNGLNEESNVDLKITEALLDELSRYSWPGNIRELKNCIDRLKVLNPEKNILDFVDLIFPPFQETEKSKPQIIHSNSIDTNSDSKIHSKEDSIIDMKLKSGLKSEQRIIHIKSLFKKYRILSRAQIMEITNLNPITVSKDLKRLCEENFIVKKTPTKSCRSNYYELTT